MSERLCGLCDPFRMSPVDVVWKLLGTIVGVFLDLLTFLQLTLRTPQAVAAGESISTQATRSIRGAKDETAPGHRRRSFHPGPTFSILRMARCAHSGETRYADPLASERISVVLEMEVPTCRASPGARRGSEADR